MTEWLTLVLVLITGFYAWQTRKTVRVMEDTNEANNRPVVSVSLKDRIESVSFVDLVITNAGNGLARDVKFKVIGDELKIESIGPKERTLKDLNIIKYGIKVLAPREERRFWLLSLLGKVEEIVNKKVSIKITYKNSDLSKSYTDKFELDFMSLPDSRLGHDPLHKISKESEKVRKEIEKIRRKLERS